MPIYVGSTELCTLGDLKIGDQDVQEVYVGSTKVFPCSSGKNLYLNEFQWGNSVLLPLASTGLVATKDFSIEYEGFITSLDDYCNIVADHLGPDSYDWEFGFSLSLDPYGQDMVQPYAYALINDFDSLVDVPTYPDIIGYLGTWTKVRFDIDVSESTCKVTVTNFRGVTAEFDAEIAHALTDTNVPDNLETHYQMNSWGSIRNVKIWQEDTLLAHWPIDDESSVSGQIRDVSGNGNHGTYRAMMDMEWAEESERDTLVRFKLNFVASGGDEYIKPDDYPWVSCWLRNGSGQQKTNVGYYEMDPLAYETPENGLHWSSSEQIWQWYPLLYGYQTDIYTTEYYLFVNVWTTTGPPDYDWADMSAYLPTQYPNHYQSGDWYDSADAVLLGSDTIYEIVLTQEPP